MISVQAPDLLATIVAATTRAVAIRQATRSIADLRRATARQPDGRSFVAALRAGGRPRIIAECKRRSPSRGILRANYEPAVHARSYQAAGAAAISVLTEPAFFDGSIEHLKAVRDAVALPLLRKDFIVSEYQLHEAAAAGADAVLLIVGALDHAAVGRLLSAARLTGLAALVEAHNEHELATALDAGADVIGINSRNLRTLGVEPDVFDRLISRIPPQVVKVAESGIKSGDDIRHLEALGYDAFLVGERLIAQADPGAALRQLRTS